MGAATGIIPSNFCFEKYTLRFLTYILQRLLLLLPCIITTLGFRANNNQQNQSTPDLVYTLAKGLQQEQVRLLTISSIEKKRIFCVILISVQPLHLGWIQLRQIKVGSHHLRFDHNWQFLGFMRNKDPHQFEVSTTSRGLSSVRGRFGLEAKKGLSFLPTLG